MTVKEVLEIEVQRSGKSIGRKPSKLSDLRGVMNVRGDAISVATHPDSQVMLAGVGKHVIGDRNKLDIGDGYARLLQCLTRGAHIRRFAKVQMSSRGRPKPALISDEQQQPVPNNNAADADERNLVRNAGCSHEWRSVALTRTRSATAGEGEPNLRWKC